MLLQLDLLYQFILFLPCIGTITYKNKEKHSHFRTVASFWPGPSMCQYFLILADNIVDIFKTNSLWQ
jgi:hypothetical protein